MLASLSFNRFTVVRRASILPLLMAFPAAAESSLAPASPAGSLMQMFVGLAITLALLIGGLYLLKRLQGVRANVAGNLRILGATAVGTREKVVLLGVGDKVLVLGVSPGRINTLHTMESSELPPSAVPSPLPGASEFAGRLRQFMERRREH